MKNNNFSYYQTLRCHFIHAHKCNNANIFWHFNIYEHDKFHAQLKLGTDIILGTFDVVMYTYEICLQLHCISVL